jgi:hypothetical protein
VTRPATTNPAHAAEDYAKARRAVRGHLVFILICIVVALLLRRMLNFPPMLSWTVFAAAGAVFAGDLIRLGYHWFKLGRHSNDEPPS